MQLTEVLSKLIEDLEGLEAPQEGAPRVVALKNGLIQSSREMLDADSNPADQVQALNSKLSEALQSLEGILEYRRENNVGRQEPGPFFQAVESAINAAKTHLASVEIPEEPNPALEGETGTPPHTNEDNTNDMVGELGDPDPNMVVDEDKLAEAEKFINDESLDTLLLKLKDRYLNTIDSLTEAQKKLLELHTTLNKALLDKAEAMTQLTVGHQKKIDQLEQAHQEKLSVLEKQIQDAEQQHNAAQKENEKLNTQVQQSEEKIQAQDQEIRDLQAENQQRAELIKQLEGVTQGLEGQLQEKDQRIQELEEIMNGLAGQVQQKDQQIQQLGKTQETLKSELDKYKRLFLQASNKLNTATDLLRILQGEVTKLKASHQAEIELLKQENFGLSLKQKEEFETAIGAIQTELERLREENKQLKEKIQNLESAAPAPAPTIPSTETPTVDQSSSEIEDGPIAARLSQFFPTSSSLSAPTGSSERRVNNELR